MKLSDLNFLKASGGFYHPPVCQSLMPDLVEPQIVVKN